MKRRAAIEPVIGHLKSDGRLSRNFLLGKLGDKLNALLCACGHNLRLIMRKMRAKGGRWLVFVLWRWLWGWLNGASGSPGQAWSARPEPVGIRC